MIVSFKHKGLKRLYEKGDARGLDNRLLPRIEEILTVLSAGDSPECADLPGFRLHTLIGNLDGFWSIKVNRNYRIIFSFDGEGFTDIDLLDYH